jgi:hypothetical protein
LYVLSHFYIAAPYISTSVAVFCYNDTCNGKIKEITMDMKGATYFKMSYGIMGIA